MKLFQPSFRAQQLLFGYGIFRLILSSGLCVLAFFPETAIELLPIVEKESLQLATVAYLALCVIGLLLTVNERLSKTPVTVLLITDLLMIMIIMRTTGGVESGFGNLMLITVGIGGLLLPLQQSLLVAAVATSSLVYTEMIPLSDSDKALLQAALLGVGFFTETLFLQYVGHRVKTTEQLAQAQADTILDLRHLNELIVQRMRTGIIVITNEGAIRLLNDAARDLMNLTEERPFWLSKPLFDRLEQWRRDSMSSIPPYQADADHPIISINFAKLQPSAYSDIIIFLEDSGRMTQQAQQLKLASLGRLTASIAHEIRNPLGAISHAAQLLEEAPNLDKGDVRLLDIIHNHSQRVNNIIETILELSRRKPGNVDAIELNTLIKQCLQERELQTKANNDEIDTSAITELTVQLDVNQIKQVLHNLIENGLRYSEQNCARRSLIIRSGIQDDTGLNYLDIQDQGKGVPEDQVKNLFEPFYTTESSGTGLGLYIAKELCEANRIQLTYIKDQPGGCFRMIFSHSIATPSQADS